MAIWYNSPNMDWMIAPLQYLGGSKHYIDGFGDQGKLSCPYTVPNNTWKYKTREWVVPDNIDINVKNDIRDVDSTAELVLVLLVYLVHWYLVHLYPLVPDSY